MADNECQKRQEQSRQERDGSIGKPIYRCLHEGCEQYAKKITLSICETCAMRVPPNAPAVPFEKVPEENRTFKQPRIMPDGSIVYEKTGWEPPAPHPGYRRKSNNLSSPDAWVFVPLMQPCQDRILVNDVKACGCLRVRPFCKSEQSGYLDKPVDESICSACPFRRDLTPS